MRIEALTPGQIFAELHNLSALLSDAVESGASIGFLWPMEDGEADAYWRSTVTPVTEGTRLLLVAREDSGEIVGSGQLDLATRPNGRHRAEIVRLIVYRQHRRRGIASAIMRALEEIAADLGRTTLHLDTNSGDGAEQLYQSLGWTLVGGIPDYALSTGGTPKRNAIYYKLLNAQSSVGERPADQSATA